MSTTLIEFPCDFSIKIIGKNTPAFASEILHMAKQVYSSLTEQAIRSKLSKNEQYLSLTLTVHAEDKTTLDTLYQALTKHPDVHMVL